jgi:lipoate synthase
MAGGAAHYARVVAALREHCPGVRVELLVPDFAGSREALAVVLAAQPDILAHTTWKPCPGFILKCGGALITGVL